LPYKHVFYLDMYGPDRVLAPKRRTAYVSIFDELGYEMMGGILVEEESRVCWIDQQFRSQLCGLWTGGEHVLGGCRGVGVSLRGMCGGGLTSSGVSLIFLVSHLWWIGVAVPDQVSTRPCRGVRIAHVHMYVLYNSPGGCRNCYC